MGLSLSCIQGDCRTYSYVAALSSDDKVCYKDLMTLAKLIPRICHNVNRFVGPHSCSSYIMVRCFKLV